MKTSFKSLFSKVISKLVILDWSKCQFCYFSLNFLDKLGKLGLLFANSGMLKQIQKGDRSKTITFQEQNLILLILTFHIPSK